jgi:hypothetical protein
MNHSHGPVRGQVSPALNPLGFNALSAHNAAAASNWAHAQSAGLAQQSLPRLNTSPPPCSSPMHPSYGASNPLSSAPMPSSSSAQNAAAAASTLLSALLASQPQAQPSKQDTDIVNLLVNRLTTVGSQLAAAQKEQADASHSAEQMAVMAKLHALAGQAPAQAELQALHAQLRAQVSGRACVLPGRCMCDAACVWCWWWWWRCMCCRACVMLVLVVVSVAVQCCM